MKTDNVREVALNLINRIDKDASYSHLIISETIQKSNLNHKDEGLLTEIVYGTINWKMTLDYYLEDYLKKQKKLRPWVVNLLRLSVYQMAFLDRVPTFAVINEAVMIAKQKGHKGIASLVNAVLRNIDRHGLKSFEGIEDQALKIAISTSHPKFLVERWIEAYGIERASMICQENQVIKATYIRVNLTKVSLETVMDELSQENIEFEKIDFLPSALKITAGNVLKTNLLKDGKVTIQDLSSMLAAEALAVEEGMQVLDTCAAPGGKSTYIAEKMHGTGQVYAFDLHEKKIKLIKTNAKRLGLRNIKARATDARQLESEFEVESFDRIITDVPCSGLGVIRSKPDIKYSKSIDDIERLSEIQFDILSKNAKLLKKGGKLIYSTCTIDKKENDDVIARFLSENKSFEIDLSFIDEMKQFEKVLISSFGLQIFPFSFQSDGFFITRLQYK